MTPEQVIDIARAGVWVMIKIGAPTMIVALLVGVAISLVQAITSIQESTLAFVPKLVAVLLTFALTTPFVLVTLKDFTRELYGQIVQVGAPG